MLGPREYDDGKNRRAWAEKGVLAGALRGRSRLATRSAASLVDVDGKRWRQEVTDPESRPVHRSVADARLAVALGQHTMMDDTEAFDSVRWETTPAQEDPASESRSPYRSHEPQPSSSSSTAHPPDALATSVSHVQVKDAKTELEGTKDTFVSYLVSAKVSASWPPGTATGRSSSPPARRPT